MNTRQLSKLVLPSLLMSAAACSTPDDQGSESISRAADAPVELRIKWWGSPDRANRTNAVIAMFNAQNPDIHVTGQWYPATQSGPIGTAYWPTLNDDAAHGTLPDVMQHDYAYIEEWTDRGLLAPLDGYAQGGPLDLSDVPATLVDGGRVHGALMGLSLGLNTQAMVLDLDVFAAAQMALPSDSWTWKDFRQIAAQIHERLGLWGAGSGLHGYTPGWKAVFLSKGQWVFSADNKSLGYTDDGPWVDHWKMLLGLEEEGAIPRLEEEPVSSNVDKLPMVFGKSAMEHLHSNQLVAMWTAAGASRNFKIMPLPRVEGGISPVYMKPSQYFSITSTSALKTQAARFINFFTNDIEANKILGGERGVPIANKVLAALKPTLSRQAAESFDLVARATAYATTLPPNDPPAWTTILTTIFTPKVEQPVMRGEINPKKACEQFRVEANAILAQ
jgi:multiple sugar transport system substrate-binding protein